MPPEKEEGKEQEQELPDAAEKILKAVQDKLDEKKDAPPPASQPTPDPAKAQAEWRDNKKKAMGWNDAQVDSYLQDIRSAQAPLVKDNSLLKLRTSQKDFEALEKPFMAEVERYEKAGRTIDASLAEELFYMVKGKELSAGRYSPSVPSSQPKRDVPRNDRDRTPSRMAPSYNPSEPSSAESKERSDASSLMNDEEKDYLGFLDKVAAHASTEISAEDYVKHRGDKLRGRREVVDRTVKRMEIDDRSSGAADRDLAALWNRSGAARRKAV